MGVRHAGIQGRAGGGVALSAHGWLSIVMQRSRWILHAHVSGRDLKKY